MLMLSFNGKKRRNSDRTGDSKSSTVSTPCLEHFSTDVMHKSTSRTKEPRPLAVLSIAVLLCISSPALAQALSSALATPVLAAVQQTEVTLPAPDVAVPVLYAYATLDKQQVSAPMCWQVLVPERDIQIREHNAKPWLLRNLVPIAGAVMGGAVGGLLLRQHAISAVITRRWALPVIAAGAAGGYFAGPGGVTGFVVGAAIGEKLGKRKLPITLGTAAAGGLLGIKLWNKVFPPDIPPAPQADPAGDIDVEVFVRDEICGTTVQTAYSQSMYRVAYRLNGEEKIADLAYDPGDALLVNAAGIVTGPARIRLD